MHLNSYKILLLTLAGLLSLFLPINRYSSAKDILLDSSLRNLSQLKGRVEKVFIIPAKKIQFASISRKDYVQEIFYFFPRNGIKGDSINYVVFADGEVFRANKDFQRNLSPSSLKNKEVGIIAIYENNLSELEGSSFKDSVKKLITEEIIPFADLKDKKDISTAKVGFKTDTSSIILDWKEGQEGSQKIIEGMEFDTNAKKVPNLSTVNITSAANLQPNTVTELQIPISNDSDFIAHFGETMHMQIRSENDSPFFVTDIWANTRTALSDKENVIDAKSSRTYMVKFKTPLLPGEAKGKFSLVLNEKVLTEFEIKLNIGDYGQKVLKVRPNGLGYLTVRKDATTSSEDIGRATPGAIYQFTEEKNNFYKIDFNGKEGWVSARFVEVVK